MNTETINTQLYEKMFAEQERYRDWLLHQPPEEILNHTYEYTTREDILMTLEDNDLSFEQAWALLSSPTPLADVFKEFESRETDYMDVVRESMASRANTIIDRHQAPLYLHDAAYAVAHNEMEHYTASLRISAACKNMIEDAIAAAYQDNILSQQMEIQTASILALDKAYRQQRQSTHDFQNHLCTISDLLSQKAYETAAKYVQELNQAQTSRILIVNTHHPIIDAILNQKYQTAIESQIEMQFCINDLSSIQLSASKLVVLLSNLLDNSIEACRRIETGRQIQCTILEKNGFFLSIRNTSPPVLITEHGIATTKLSASEHGFGLPSVCRILASLHAEYVYDYEDGWFQFTAEIPTKLEE